MEVLIPSRLSTLGHPQRLALFRLLMRRYPDRVPANELAQALDVKPSTLSNYVNALMQAGLVTQERVGTSLRYAIHMDAARETFGLFAARLLSRSPGNMFTHHIYWPYWRQSHECSQI